MLASEDLSKYGSDPDSWHNLIMEAQIVDEFEIAYMLSTESLRQWPDNVDLLCDRLLLSLTHFRNADEAERIVNRLSALEDVKPYWRYWVNVGLYQVRMKNDRLTALQLLDEGLKHIRTDSLRDIFAAYRRVLVDAPPSRSIDSLDDLGDFYDEAKKVLEGRLRTGVTMGIENGHTLLIELAKLALENAVTGFEEGTSRPQVDTDQLNAALSYVEAAEQMFVGDANHRISAVYIVKAKILMALRRFREAQEIMLAIPAADVGSDPSIETMFEYASISLGLPNMRVQRETRDQEMEIMAPDEQ